jgi:replicative DNA helicase
LYRKAQPWSPDFEFATTVPDENEKYVRTIDAEVEAAGGLTEFWNLTKFSGLPTPFPKLNWALGGGMRPSEVYVVGGNQGTGKTSLALQFALNALRKRHSVLIFSMEMSWRAVFQRMAAIQAHIDLHAFRTAQLRKEDTRDEMLRLSRATAEIAGWNLQVSTKPSVTPEYVATETKRLAKRRPIDLLVVDHMQLMGADANTRGDYEKFTAISRAMKHVAVDVNVPVLLVSQTSRSNSRERRSELDVADLRGSGAIEEDAAAVFLLFEDQKDAEAARTDVNNGKTRYMTGPVQTWLKIGKNRYGVQGAFLSLRHYKTETRFETTESEVPDGE